MATTIKGMGKRVGPWAGTWVGCAIAILVATATVLLFMGRPPICTCGTVELWHGVVQSAGNSQHISDWYTPSHIIHGFLFYAAAAWALRKYPKGAWLCAALLIECGWEILENSPMVIERYREQTMAFGYTGDSVLNSVCDALWMCVGFALAVRLKVWVTATIAVVFELFTLAMIRDNLTLNVLMLVWPVEAIKVWQGGA